MGSKKGKGKHVAHLVKTKRGNGLVSKGGMVKKHVEGDRYVLVHPSDLEKKDKIAWRMEGYQDVELSDVDRVLYEGSIRYHNAKDRLYSDPEKGITQFRVDLLNAYSDKLTGISGLESKISGETDFAPDELNAVAETLREELLRNKGVADAYGGAGVKHPLGEDTIKDWVTGETLVPQHWEVMDALADQSEEFPSYWREVGDQGMQAVVSYFKNTRTRIGRRISMWDSEDPERSRTSGSTGANRSDSESIDEEWNIVVDNFVDNKRRGYVLTEVREVQELEGLGKIKKARASGVHEGIVLGESGDFYRTEGNVKQIMEAEQVLRSSLEIMNYLYLQKDNAYHKALCKRDARLGNGPIAAALSLSSLIHTAELVYTNSTALGSGSTWEEHTTPTKEEIGVAKRVYKDIRSGVYDAKIGTTPGTVGTLLTTGLKLKGSIPPIFLEAEWTDDDPAPSHVLDLQDTIKQRYGFTAEAVNAPMTQFIQEVYRNSKGRLPGVVGEFSVGNSGCVQTVADILREKGTSTLRKADYEKHLCDFGLGEVMRAIPSAYFSAE